MIVAALDRPALQRRLRDGGLRLQTGAFATALDIELEPLLDDFVAMYGAYAVSDEPSIDDFSVRIAAPSLLRRHFRPQAASWIDGEQLIEPLPLDQALPCLESSLNLAVVYSDVAPLVVHSAALERDGRALVMPAPSGSGKSTLCAVLAWRGWRLMSDEMTIFDFETRRLLANPRPVSLKNRSRDVVAAHAPQARFSRIFRGTNKGDIAYMRAPDDAVARCHETAGPGLIVAPVYRAGAGLEVREMSRTDAFRWLTDNAVNYASMLQHGFDCVADLVERSGLYTLTYSDLDAAIAAIDALHRRHRDG